MKQKLENKQNYIRDDVGVARVIIHVVEAIANSLVSEQAKEVLQSWIICAK